MRDVLHVIEKLPERCATVIDGEAFFIRRGASHADDALIPVEMVDLWNSQNNVSPEQRRAMEIGLAVGWDKEGAEVEGGPYTYKYVASVSFSVDVQAASEEQALKLANERARGEWQLDTIDLIETDDPTC